MADSSVAITAGTGTPIRVLTGLGAGSADQQVITLADSVGNLLGTSAAPVPVTDYPATPTTYALTAAATTNAAVVKASAGTLYSIVFSNIISQAAYLKVYNLAAAPTVGTSVPVMTFAAAASSSVVLDFGTLGIRLGTGIAVAITANAVSTDVTGLSTPGDLLLISYI